MDLSKLTPAPWEPSYADGDPTKEILSIGHPRPELAEKWPADKLGQAMRRDLLLLSPRGGIQPDDAAFICLARMAFDVMQRRGWFPISVPGRSAWRVGTRGQHYGVEVMEYQNPFTALVEADEWYKANVESESK